MASRTGPPSPPPCSRTGSSGSGREGLTPAGLGGRRSHRYRHRAVGTPGPGTGPKGPSALGPKSRRRGQWAAPVGCLTFREVRAQAGLGQTAAQLVASTHLPQNIADAAVANPINRSTVDGATRRGAGGVRRLPWHRSRDHPGHMGASGHIGMPFTSVRRPHRYLGVEHRNGRHIWTTPDGNQYIREPEPIAEPQPPPKPKPQPEPQQRDDPTDEPPPF